MVTRTDGIEPIDQVIADTVTRHIDSISSDGDEGPVAAPATWALCNILTDHGLATSASTGVSTRRIGPFRLALVEDAPRDLHTMIVSLIPIAITAACGSATLPTATYISSLTFAFRVLAATFCSGSIIDDPLEWNILLSIKHANGEIPPRYPSSSDIVVQFGGAPKTFRKEICSNGPQHSSSTASEEDSLQEITRIFCDRDRATLLALRAGYPATMIPEFKTPLLFWSKIAAEARNGLLRDGIRPIIAHASEMYPNNAVLAQGNDTASGQDNGNRKITLAHPENATLKCIERLQKRKPLWGKKQIALIQQRDDGGLESLA